LEPERSSERATGAAPGRSPAAERILDAAEAVFAEGGLSGASMRLIGRRAGLTAASLYHHFPSKDALYEAVLERGLRPILELLRASAAAPPGSDATGRLLEALMAHIARTPRLARLIQHEAVAGGAHLSRLARAHVRPLVLEAVAQLKREGASTWSPEDLPLLVAAWLHIVLGYFANAALLGEVFDMDLLSEEALARQTRFLRKLAPRVFWS
jgi:AcrR family transcriptional regulator